jgi:inhibitor of KinA sporulation pathway (predicted exonuclease)
LLKSQIFEVSPWPFGQHYIDAKNLYQSWKLVHGADHLKGGLARAMTKLGLKFDGRKHNAKDDAYNTFKIYSQLLKEFK